ncbi:hypothetical protein B5F84_04945, partial [Olsenella sp. An290]
DTTALEASIAAAEAADTEGKTAESVAALEEALDAARAALADPEATQATVDAAASALDAAVAGLTDEVVEPEPVEKGELQSAADAASGLAESDYTAESWGPFAEALDQAQAVLSDPDATQDEVDAALAALTAARDALVRADAGEEPGGSTQPGGGEEPGGSTQPGGGEEPGGSTQPGGGEEPGGSTQPGSGTGTGSGSDDAVLPETGGPGLAAGGLAGLGAALSSLGAFIARCRKRME